MARVLVVDDEKLIVKGLKFSLEQDGMTVDCAYDGEEAVRLISKNDYDIVLLDLMLPQKNGLEVCQEVRGFSDVPIIMLTAKSEDMDKIMGLEYGADDYITKPFNILEVKARIKAVTRRSRGGRGAASKADGRITLRGLTIDSESRRIFINDTEVNLTTKEFDLLQLLLENPGKVFTREQLLQLIWGPDYPGDVRTVDVHVRRLREKVEANPSDPKYVFTKWGVGYFYKD